MTIRTVLEFPHPILKQKTKPVDVVDDAIRTLVTDMFETMYADNGVGLAANQIGVDKRIFVIDASHSRDEPKCFINPEIVATEGEVESDEGCLSFPGTYVKVKRAKWVHFSALNEQGEQFELKTDEFMGIVMQHEFDHLKGITFLDHLSGMKRQRALKRLEKFRKLRSPT